MLFDDTKYKKWMEKYSTAYENMKTLTSNNGVLIEVAAQHPLLEGLRPNEEFEKRLLKGLELYNDNKEKNKLVKIYVPGSRHMEDNIADKISLSKAGCEYLISKGVPETDLYGEDANSKYKGEQGVYNSSDECYVASLLFEELQFAKLHCVCSSAQMMRKALSYIEFGYLPYMHTITCDEMYHNYIDEIFIYIPMLLNADNALQGDSEEADRLRQIRKPQE